VGAQTFVKVEGLGNDFLILDQTHQTRAAVDLELARLRRRAPEICDRRRGVGADGILVLAPPFADHSHATMLVVNHDGSRPEMCGNGLRCVAHYVADRLKATTPVIDTDAGTKTCRVEGRPADPEVHVEVEMGPARDLGWSTPRAGGSRRFRSVSMGNPHAVYFVDEDEDPRELAQTLGAALERDAAYPDRTNVEFARVSPNGRTIVLWVWERGCGITQACGTGACATACAAAWQGLVPTGTAVTVRLPGGDLAITVPEDPDHGVLMRGPARRVFTGTVVI
jgi:diaminopimelate epimerase